MAPDLRILSLSDAARLIGAGELSPLELTEACIERAGILQPKLNAYLTPTFENALDEAARASKEIAAGNYRGPLHGIPFALKDLYETAGVRTTAGSPIRERYVPQTDAYTVQRLKAAGVVMLGKLGMHEWALGATNLHAFFPSVRNPWNLSRVSGGSSGGSAAAIAGGLCLGTLGSDTRGSIRIPASLCGITGLKPTYGRVSLRGVVPLSWSLDHAGPMARTAEDCAHILCAIAGYDPLDPTSIDRPIPDYVAQLGDGLKGKRIGVPRNFFFDEDVVNVEVARIVLESRLVFEDLGAEIIEVEFPDLGRLMDGMVFLADAAVYHEAHLRNQADLISEDVRIRLERALEFRATEYSAARFRQLELKRALGELFQKVDLILTPTTVLAAPLAATAGAARILVRNTAPFNVSGTPAVSVPCGFTADGLPVGLSLAGPAWTEGRVLGAAHVYQQATDWHRRSPPFCEAGNRD